MNIKRFFQKDLTGHFYADGRDYNTRWNRFEQSPAGWIFAFYIFNSTLIFPILFYYDLINGHELTGFYTKHIFPILWAPIIEPIRWTLHVWEAIHAYL